MPTFEIIPASDIPKSEPTGRRVEILSQYNGYVEQLGRGQAGKLTPVEGETTQALRRRLAAAVKGTGVNLIVRRNGQDIYFWAKPRRGRPPKVA